MKIFINIFAAIIAGATCAPKSPQRESLLQLLFGHLIPNRYSLVNAYFTVRPESAPPKSPWYRFNLTYGEMTDIGDKLTPKDDKQTCIAECSNIALNARCHFDIKHASITYNVKMSYRAPVVAEFVLYAWVTEFQFYDHRNPALLSMSIVKTRGYGGRQHDVRECLITEITLEAVTFPPFSSLDFFKDKEPSLPDEVWKEFEVKLYTVVRLIIMNTLKQTCLAELRKKNVSADSACSQLS